MQLQNNIFLKNPKSLQVLLATFVAIFLPFTQFPAYCVAPPPLKKPKHNLKIRKIYSYVIRWATVVKAVKKAKAVSFHCSRAEQFMERYILLS